MDEREFKNGLEGERQNGEDLVSGAEHLVRLKKQVGYENRRDDDLGLEIDKTAATHKDLPNTARRAASGASSKVKEVASALKSKLRKKPMLRAAVIGGAASGTVNAAMGAASAPPGHRTENAIRQGVTGAALGAGGGALFHHLQSKLAQFRKEAGLKDKLDTLNYGTAAMMAGGGIAGGLGTYLASRPQKDTGKSRAEEELEESVAGISPERERGLLKKMKNRTTEMTHGYAKAFREHPVKAGLLGTASGIGAGYGLSRAAGGLLNMYGAKK